MNDGEILSCLARKHIDMKLCREVEEYGYVLASFSTDAFLINCPESHVVYVYEFNKRKFWLRKYNGKVMEFRDIT